MSTTRLFHSPPIVFHMQYLQRHPSEWNLLRNNKKMSLCTHQWPQALPYPELWRQRKSQRESNFNSSHVQKIRLAEWDRGPALVLCQLRVWRQLHMGCRPHRCRWICWTWVRRWRVRHTWRSRIHSPIFIWEAFEVLKRQTILKNNERLPNPKYLPESNYGNSWASDQGSENNWENDQHCPRYTVEGKNYISEAK